MRVHVYHITHQGEGKGVYPPMNYMDAIMRPKASLIRSLLKDEDPLVSYEHVAALELPNDADVEDTLDEMWRLTNSIDHEWTLNHEVKWAPARNIRSSMVGDVFVVGGMKWVVDRVGFTPVPEEPTLAERLREKLKAA